MLLIQHLIKEPLLHFLLLGIGLFAAFAVINGDTSTDDSQVITVTEERLLTFLQYRARRFDNNNAAGQLAAMTAAQRQQLVDAFVREEVLYREAKALALDSNDYVARQRLIQQMRYLTESFIQITVDNSDKAMAAYFNQHQQRYRKPAEATFTHVFFSTAQRTPEEARALAEQQLSELNNQSIPFHRATAFGERFLYHRNYVKKEADHIASHFGEPMQRAIFALSPNDSQWQGPYQSPYGFHLVLLTQNTPAAIPPLADIKDRVLQDSYREQQQLAVNRAIEALVARYQIQTPALSVNQTDHKPLAALGPRP